MSIDNSLHVLAASFERNFYSSMDNDIMKNKIEKAVAKDAYTNKQ